MIRASTRKTGHGAISVAHVAVVLLLIMHALLASLAFLHATAPAAEAATISFLRKTILTKASPGASLLDNPTTMALGPDRRLYVGQQNGRIHVLTLDASYNVTAVQVVNTIYNTPNKKENGTPTTGFVL